jgi:hypothetical protein
MKNVESPSKTKSSKRGIGICGNFRGIYSLRFQGILKKYFYDYNILWYSIKTIIKYK